MYVHTKTIYTKIDFGIDSIKTEMRILFQITWMKRLLLRWNEQRINWSRSPLCRPGACRNLWYKLPDRIELGPTRRDWYCKNMQDLSHYRRNDSRPPESVVYAVLTSLSCFCSETKFRNSLRSCSTPSFIYLPNLSFINKYMFSWDLLSFFIIYPFLFMLIDVIQKFTPITFDYFIHAGSHVLHF